MHYKEWIAHLPAYKPPKLIGKQADNVVKLSSNENPLGPSPRAVAALQDHLTTIHRYPDSSALALRQALADHVGLPPEMVIATNGSDELVFLLCMAFLREGDEVVMAKGSFISYLLRTIAAGGRPIRVPLRDATHDLDAMAAAITPHTRLLFICNPNNPTGTTNNSTELETLLQRVPDDVLVVVDEAYCEYVQRPDYPDLVPELQNGRANLILLRTFAKIYGLAGMRLGYGFAHPNIVNYLNKARPIFNVNALAQAAGIAALSDTEHVEQSAAYAGSCRMWFTRELAERGLSMAPSQTNFVMVHVGDDAAVTEQLHERGFTVTPLSGWGIPGAIRISFGTEEQNQRFLAALDEVLAAGGGQS
jgi:histidinol-phosphate aminotransferase